MEQALENKVSREASQPLQESGSPFDSRVSLPILAARLAGAALVVAALLSGSRRIEWMAVMVLAWVVVVVWGRHVLFAENLECLPKLRADLPRDASSPPLPGVSIIVPARNEEAGIEPAAQALAAIDYPALEILMIDDHSSDATPRILDRLAREFPRLRVLAAPDLSVGWTGKTNASTFGFQRSNPDSRWLLFTDARVMFHPNAVLAAITHAEANGLDFLSCILRFEGKGLMEELNTMIQNRGLVMNARAFGGGPPAMAFGHGSFTLIRREVYAACGGHARFPGHPLEDFMLADTARRWGAATSVAIASEIVAIRRYHGFADLRRRVVRAFRTASSDSVLNLIDRLSLEFCLNVLPLLVAAGALLRMSFQNAEGAFQPALAVIAVLAFLAYLAGTCTPRSCGTICGFRPWVAWFYPLGSALWTCLLVQAISEVLRGHALSWRGREIDAGQRARALRSSAD